MKKKHQILFESLQQYVAEIARLARLAFLAAPKDFLLRLIDVEIQQALRLGHSKKLGDARAGALEFEAAKQALRSHLRVRQTRRYPCKDRALIPQKHHK